MMLSISELAISASLPASIPTVLAAVGKALDIDRLLVLAGAPPLASRDDALQYEWERSDDILRFAAIEEAITESSHDEPWVLPLAHPAMANSNDATGFIAQVMQVLRTRSTLHIPIFVAGTYWGRIIADDCANPREWASIEIEALTVFANVIGGVLSHEETRTRIEQLVRYEPVTGLPNRRMFIETLAREIGRPRDADQGFGVLVISLDNFEDIEASRGHGIGNGLLQAVAERLRVAIREIDTLARFNTSTFTVLEIDGRDPADLARLADRLVDLFDQPFDVAGEAFRTTVSVGVAAFEPPSLDAESLLARAQLALGRAKTDGGHGYRFYTDAMDANMRTRVTLEKDLGHAITAGQLELHYQPQVDTRSNVIVGFEALVRWRHPTRGMISPAHFIPAAEKTGQVVAIGSFAMREACLQMKRWMDLGIAPPLIAVNVSVVQFRAPLAFTNELESILVETGVAAHQIEIELTESVLMEASTEHANTLERIRALGFRLDIDDFGNGYSSLDYLRRLHVDRIKIPRNFTTDLCRLPKDASIVQALLNLARDLAIDVIVEGVESEEELLTLMAMGCRFVQGFYYSKPLSVVDATDMLRIGRVMPAASAPMALAP
jgi:diguanylate cyclase (GGDEF)-like protein